MFRGFNVQRFQCLKCPTQASSSIYSPTRRRHLPNKESRGSQKLPVVGTRSTGKSKYAYQTAQIIWKMTER